MDLSPISIAYDQFGTAPATSFSQMCAFVTANKGLIIRVNNNSHYALVTGCDTTTSSFYVAGTSPILCLTSFPLALPFLAVCSHSQCSFVCGMGVDSLDVQRPGNAYQYADVTEFHVFT